MEMRKSFKTTLAFFLAFVIIFGATPLSGFMGLKQPGWLSFGQVKASAADYQTGDHIYFGSYPQTKVTDSSLVTALDAQTLEAGDTVTYDGNRYKRLYFTEYTPDSINAAPNAQNSFQDNNGYYINTVYWFQYEPIQWRVLSNKNGELFVLSEKILASRAYNQVLTSVTWETCTLRSWLNNDFYNAAFSLSEQSKITASTVVNEDNPWYDMDGGNDTVDKVFQLSYEDVFNTAYGFSTSYSTDLSRWTQGSDFAKSNGFGCGSDADIIKHENRC